MRWYKIISKIRNYMFQQISYIFKSSAVAFIRVLRSCKDLSNQEKNTFCEFSSTNSFLKFFQSAYRLLMRSQLRRHICWTILIQHLLWIHQQFVSNFNSSSTTKSFAPDGIKGTVADINRYLLRRFRIHFTNYNEKVQVLTNCNVDHQLHEV